MPVAAQMVTANEAAALAMVEIRDIHRAFDEHILPEALLGSAATGRQVARGAVPLIAFYFRTASVLQADARRAVIQLVASEGRTGALRRVMAIRRRTRLLPVGGGVTVSLAPFIVEVDERAKLIEQARAMVVLDPEILGGSEPVIAGTRVPVFDVAASAAAGVPVTDILRSYPSLSTEQVELAALYASVERPRGRPRRSLAERLPPGARMVSSMTVPRPVVASPRRPASGPAPAA